MTLTINPVFKNHLPPLSNEAYDNLKNSILANGCLVPIVIWDGTIVDGHNRYEICQEHGIPFEVMEEHFHSEAEALLWITVQQLGRRNLSAVEMVLQALKEKPTLIEIGKSKKGFRSDLHPFATGEKHSTRDIVAKMAGVQPWVVQAVEYVWENGDAEIQEQVRSGEISLSKALDTVRDKHSKEVCTELVTQPIHEPEEPVEEGMPAEATVPAVDPGQTSIVCFPAKEVDDGEDEEVEPVDGGGDDQSEVEAVPYISRDEPTDGPLRSYSFQDIEREYLRRQSHLVYDSDTDHMISRTFQPALTRDQLIKPVWEYDVDGQVRQIIHCMKKDICNTAYYAKKRHLTKRAITSVIEAIKGEVYETIEMFLDEVEYKGINVKRYRQKEDEE